LFKKEQNFCFENPPEIGLLLPKPGSNSAESGDFDSKCGEIWRFLVFIWQNGSDFEARISITVASIVAIFETKLALSKKIILTNLDFRNPDVNKQTNKKTRSPCAK